MGQEYLAYVDQSHVKVLPNGNLKKRDFKPGEEAMEGKKHQPFIKIHKVLRKRN